jgi:hypothetical protein
MDMIGLENSFGVACLIAALLLLILVKGSKPYELTTLLVGLFLIVAAATTAATFSNFAEIAKLLSAKRLIESRAFDNSLRINSLWVLIYPAFVGAIGVNLLTSWFQSCKSKTETDPVQLIKMRRFEERDRLLDTERNPAASALPPSRHRSRKNMRATLVRKR